MSSRSVTARRRRWNCSLPEGRPSHGLPIASARFRPFPPIAWRPCRRLRSCGRDHLVEQLPHEADRIDLIVVAPGWKSQELCAEIGEPPGAGRHIEAVKGHASAD